ncbi:MAG: ABC transporter substrate-binding protein [Candidatus Bathyarchaeia archaeon]
MRKIILASTIILIVLIGFLGIYLFSWQRENPTGKGRIEVTDALGRTVEIALPVKRVIITGQSAWPIITVAYMFSNAKSLLYGLGKDINVPLFQLVDPNIESKIDLDIYGTGPNLEAVASKNPDVVILKSTMKSNLGDPLEELGFKVVYVDFESLDSYMRDVLVLGKIFGDEIKAQEIARHYNKTYSLILSRTYKMYEKPKVLFLYYSTKGGTVSFQTPGAGWLQTFMIEVAGGCPVSGNLTGKGWNTISFEQIASWNPEVIFLVTYTDSPSATDVKNMLFEDPNWRWIKAVAQKRVYAVPHDCNNVMALGSWDTPGSRWILGLQWMALKIHPSIFSDVDITEEAKKFYMEMYGLNEDEAARVINGIKGDLT